jgi:hypothetical protein
VHYVLVGSSLRDLLLRLSKLVHFYSARQQLRRSQCCHGLEDFEVIIDFCGYWSPRLRHNGVCGGLRDESGDSFSINFSADWENIGDSGKAAYLQSTGLNQVATYLGIANYPGGIAAYTLSGTASLFVGTTSGGTMGDFIGWVGNGTFNQSGGTHTDTFTTYLGVNA